MKQTDEFLRMLDEKLRVTDEDGVVLQVALVATIYIANMHQTDVRQAVIACCESYFQRYGSCLRWALQWAPYSDTRQMERFGAGNGSRPREWLLSLDEHESYSLSVHGAEWHLGAAPYSLVVLGCRRAEYPDLGYLRFAVPVPTLSSEPNLVPTMLLEFCERLKPASGYAGIGIVESLKYAFTPHYDPIVYGVAQRFPGLEVDYPVWHSNYLWKGEGSIKGVNWLTVVGDRLLDRLGGADAVRSELAALDSGFAISRYDGGIMIRAGDRPDLGDAVAGDWPVLYVKLAKYLKPLRVVSHPGYHRPSHEGLDVFDDERTQAWLRRFEDR